ncbi:hypothetical protein [Lentzea sp. E54]|uniref:hypothetical protein n=1 Tax=Lentzea xerophila TaxID=3435883 RepID=UPI003DA2696E
MRRTDTTDPASLFPATVLTASSHLAFGVVPRFRIAVRSAIGTAVVMKSLLALGFLSGHDVVDRPACVPFVTGIAGGTGRVDWTFAPRVAGSTQGALPPPPRPVANPGDTSSDTPPALVLHTSTGT